MTPQTIGDHGMTEGWYRKRYTVIKCICNNAVSELLSIKLVTVTGRSSKANNCDYPRFVARQRSYPSKFVITHHDHIKYANFRNP